ncbi:MAG: DUF3592 domain-containing protein [Acidobacteriota bacterium]
MLKAIGGLVGYWFFAALFFIGVIYIGVPAYQSLSFAHRVGTFPEVRGVMTGHSMQTETTLRNIDEHGPTETRVTHTPWLKYRFLVGDQFVNAEEMFTAELTGHAKVGHGRAMALVERYPEGSEVTVFYNPENPFEASLATDATKRFWAVQIGHMTVALITLGLVGWCLWRGVRSVTRAGGRSEREAQELS